MTTKLTSILLAVGLVLALSTMSCAGRQPDGDSDQGAFSGLRGVTLDGAGASFPYPVYSMWAYEFEELSGMMINYQSVGSGAGISSIRQNTVDFGASDAPLRADELDAYGLIQFPMIIGGVVPVINVAGIGPGELRLSEDVFADIFLGNITMWNDERIASINPGVDIPDKPIVVVHRADGSGTTWIFSSFLSEVSSEWMDRVGVGKSLAWPTGIGGRGNEGVASFVGEVHGAVGYVEYAYAHQNDMTYALLRNRAGNYVAPTIDSFAGGAAHPDRGHPPRYHQVVGDQVHEQFSVDHVGRLATEDVHAHGRLDVA